MEKEKISKLGMFLYNYAEPFKHSKAFPYLWGGETIAYLGNCVMNIVLPSVVYSISGSAGTMGLVMAVYMLMYVVMLPVSGGLVDRYDRLRLMMGADLVRFLITALGAVLILTHHLTLPILLILISFYGLMNGLFQPAYAAMRAVVFVPEIRNQANALTQASEQTVRLIGPSLGGILIVALSPGWGFGFNAMTYLISFIFLFKLRRAKSSLIKRPKEKNAATGWKEDFMTGIHILRKDPWLWITILVFAVINIFYSGVTSILLPWLFNVHFHFPPTAYGAAVTCSGVGAILGGLVFGSRKHWRKRGIMAYGGVLLSGVALLAMAFVSSPYGLVALFALEGFGLMIFGLIWETSLQELVPPESFGRVASLDMLGSFALLPLGYLLVGKLADVINGVNAMMLFSAIGIVIVLAALALPGIRQFD